MSRWSSAERRRRGGILTGLIEVMLVDDTAVRSFRVRGGVRSRNLLCEVGTVGVNCALKYQPKWLCCGNRVFLPCVGLEQSKLCHGTVSRNWEQSHVKYCCLQVALRRWYDEVRPVYDLNELVSAQANSLTSSLSRRKPLHLISILEHLRRDNLLVTSGMINGSKTSPVCVAHPVTLFTGASSLKNAFSCIVAATSAPTPAFIMLSCTTIARPVRLTLSNTVSLSHGYTVRRSMSSMLHPKSFSAAAMAAPHVYSGVPYEMIVRSVPGLMISALSRGR
jgi:hypothetical protein